MKKSKAEIILDGILNTAGATADVFDIFLSVGYGASIGRMQRELSRRENRRIDEKAEQEVLKLLRQRFTKTLCKLKKDGLVVQNKTTGGVRRLFITPKGKNWLQEKTLRLLPQHIYDRVEKGSPLIVAFDVPERDRRKRAWLRAALESLGLKMVQKSLWMGNVILPEEFLGDLHTLNLIQCVKIFQVSKAGNLEEIS